MSCLIKGGLINAVAALSQESGQEVGEILAYQKAPNMALFFGQNYFSAFSPILGV